MIHGAALAATLCLTGGCSLPPNLVVARDPIPPPPPGYRVKCDTYPFLFETAIGDCREVVPVRTERRVVVRAKG
jgi:hypothetical protein